MSEANLMTEVNDPFDTGAGIASWREMGVGHYPATPAALIAMELDDVEAIRALAKALLAEADAIEQPMTALEEVWEHVTPMTDREHTGPTLSFGPKPKTQEIAQAG